MAFDLYILGDADRVRERVEKQLLAGQFDTLSEFSGTLTTAVGALAQRICVAFSADVVMAGGDDVLFRLAQDRFSKPELESLAQQFAAESGCTISFGVASDIMTAYINLRRAKCNGGNAIVDSGAMP